MKNRRGEQTQKVADWIAKLQEPLKISDFSPLAPRFVFSLRVIAVHRKAGRDPVGELTARLGSVTVAIKALQLVEVLAHAWPDPVQVRRCCCQMLSHDELTMSAALQSVADGDRSAFDQHLSDLLPREARDAIWSSASELAIAEFT